MKTALLLLATALAASATPIVQNTSSFGNATVVASQSVAYSSATSSGDLLIAACTYYNVSNVAITVSDTLVNSWQSVPVQQINDGSEFLTLQVFYVPYSKAGANTVACNYGGAGAQFTAIMIFEVSGYALKDVATGATAASGTAIASGSITTNFNPEFVFGATAFETSGTTQGGGYTALLTTAPNIGLSTEYLVQSSAGAENATFTGAGSSFWAATVVTFKAKNTAAPAVL